MTMMMMIPGNVVVVKVESDDLVERPEGRRWDEVKLVVSDGEELEVTWTHHSQVIIRNHQALPSRPLKASLSMKVILL